MGRKGGTEEEALNTTHNIVTTTRRRGRARERERERGSEDVGANKGGGGRLMEAEEGASEGGREDGGATDGGGWWRRIKSLRALGFTYKVSARLMHKCAPLIRPLFIELY